ncbi:RNA-binding protein, partial [Candidatus Peregrinibacteria bacterium]|nr:RNA-binding protein [Candidatus Peregrinibacteria bacterium]
VGNIEWGVTNEELEALFAEYGEIEEAVVVKDKFSGRSKGFGFVTFVNEEDAANAIEKLNGHDLKGRNLNVSEANPPKARD